MNYNFRRKMRIKSILVARVITLFTHALSFFNTIFDELFFLLTRVITFFDIYLIEKQISSS